MKNFEVTDKATGQKYWISRSIAVLAMVIVRDEPNGPKEYVAKTKDEIKPGDKIYYTIKSSSTGDNKEVEQYTVGNHDYVLNKYILVNKRGEGTPNYQGCWNIPCGYLDYNERLTEACTREVMEEQGVYINPSEWRMYHPIDDMVLAWDTKQNVTIRYTANLTMDEYKQAVKEGEKVKAQFAGENNEVTERELMLLTEENIQGKEWAFNHKTLLEYQLEEPTYIL